MPRVARLTREDWADAALDALADGGLPAVAVEPVAARLKASKSSFYWLFDNRQALLVAALERWERTETDEVLPALAEVADPVDRLRLLVAAAFTGGRGGAVALRLAVDADTPAVRAVVERVTRRRIAGIEAALRELGHPADRAATLAAASYAVYLGTAALHRSAAAPADITSYVDTVLAAFSTLPD
ncbi:TetR/AcrR family transcriptional regulator [Actinophytocola sediminis]